MTRQAEGSRWRECAGCGRERRLAAGGLVLCGHNRWDSVAWAMVPCEGSGREPAPPRALDLAGISHRARVGRGQAGARAAGAQRLARGRAG